MAFGKPIDGHNAQNQFVFVHKRRDCLKKLTIQAERIFQCDSARDRAWPENTGCNKLIFQSNELWQFSCYQCFIRQPTKGIPPESVDL